MSIIGGDVESAPSSVPSSTPGSEYSSPRSRVKFLCSHGGKILPRPADGHLKYVGGETRVISVPRDVNFQDLVKKLTSLIEGDMVLKYQLLPEDLDALVTVKSDEDLRHMFEESDRHELLGAPRLRTFLFPANTIITEHQIGPMDRQSLEQRYINSINGIVVLPMQPCRTFRPSPINTSCTSFSISSACSSPTTPPDTANTTPSGIPATPAEPINPEITNLHCKLSSMTRVRSSPSLCNLGASQSNRQAPSLSSGLSQSQSQTFQQHPFHHQNHRQPQPQPQPHHFHYHPHASPSHKPPLDPYPHKSCGPEHLMRIRSTGLADYYRYQMERNPPIHGVRQTRGHMFYNRSGLPYEEFYGNARYESPPGSPIARSPLQSSYNA